MLSKKLYFYKKLVGKKPVEKKPVEKSLLIKAVEKSFCGEEPSEKSSNLQSASATSASVQPAPGIKCNKKQWKRYHRKQDREPKKNHGKTVGAFFRRLFSARVFFNSFFNRLFSTSFFQKAFFNRLFSKAFFQQQGFRYRLA